MKTTGDASTSYTPRSCPERSRCRVARYIRVSRSDQRPALQADETAQFIDRRGWVLVDTFVDEGVSGAKAHRPALDRLLAAARRGEFDVLVVWRSDRLFRSLRHMVNTLAELGALGVEFVSATEPFDTTTPQGQLLMHMVAAFAEFERGVLRERTKAGIAAARRRGARVGRPRVNVDVDRVCGMRAAGLSVRRIARELNIGSSTVHRLLTATPAGVPKTSPSNGV